jgi:membrane protease subunit HflK
VLAEYQKAPQVTRDRMYLDTMQQVYGNVTKVMVDSRAGLQPAVSAAGQDHAAGRPGRRASRFAAAPAAPATTGTPAPARPRPIPERDDARAPVTARPAEEIKK